MKAQVGDRIVVVANKVDGKVRAGRIIDIRNTDGSPPYVVEWSDNGHRTIVYPGPDSHIEKEPETS